MDSLYVKFARSRRFLGLLMPLNFDRILEIIFSSLMGISKYSGIFIFKFHGRNIIGIPYLIW